MTKGFHCLLLLPNVLLKPPSPLLIPPSPLLIPPITLRFLRLLLASLLLIPPITLHLTLDHLRHEVLQPVYSCFQYHLHRYNPPFISSTFTIARTALILQLRCEVFQTHHKVMVNLLTTR
ncbi:hypothetical protein MBAV_005901 [Candidatus Magnetobacterium bavaricum]|uniref:Uncharacterized protein n=1 Tax=Candidatus Magnetobacterium bavaricum TaxID=29290 RepID=A0A0F3GJA6_9BACT|nr:hypothetical protein MBAV_005901 [Candidatus Magnetobacterium bavaricum]